MSSDQTRSVKLRRRLVTIPALFAAAGLAVVLMPVWLPAALFVDALRLRFRFPVARLLAFGTAYVWIEVGFVLIALALWITGRTPRVAPHYRAMDRWANAQMRAMQLTTGLTPRLEGAEALEGGNAVVVCRHASLGDSLLSAWAVSVQAGLWPRYVLKKELLSDPSLDIFGLRIPNHFLDRGATSRQDELDALSALAGGIGPKVVSVIFAEGTRTNDAKRARAVEKIAADDPERAEAMLQLKRLLPPRPAGTAALLAGAPEADVVLAWHTGFDGLDTFGGIVAKLSKPLPPVRFVVRRVRRAHVPTGLQFESWLDEQWLRMDAEVDAALRADASMPG